MESEFHSQLACKHEPRVAFLRPRHPPHLSLARMAIVRAYARRDHPRFSSDVSPLQHHHLQHRESRRRQVYQRPTRMRDGNAYETPRVCR